MPAPAWCSSCIESICYCLSVYNFLYLFINVLPLKLLECCFLYTNNFTKKMVRGLSLLIATQATLVKGFIVHMSGSYGKAAGAAAMGPFLGPASSGIFISRTVDQVGLSTT
jgi:hypothetical protein